VSPLPPLPRHQRMESAGASPPASATVGAAQPALETENGVRGEYCDCNCESPQRRTANIHLCLYSTFYSTFFNNLLSNMSLKWMRESSKIKFNKPDWLSEFEMVLEVKAEENVCY